jgi:uncharacterized protein (DUF2267 family)
LLPTQDRHAAYIALRAALHALRDRLTVQEGAQLPMLIRGLYYEGWNPSGKPSRVRHKEQFLSHIEEQYRGSGRFDDLTDPERMAHAVFTVLAERISAGEIEDVKHILPAELRELWPSAGPVGQVELNREVSGHDPSIVDTSMT